MTLSRGHLDICLLYLSWSLWAAAAALEKIELDEPPGVTCGQGLTGCRVKDEVIPSPDSGYVHVRKLDVRAFLCCLRGSNCTPCLRIQIHIAIDGLQDGNELSGDDDDDDDAQQKGYVSLCCNIPNGWPVCKRLEFRSPPAAVEDHHKAEVQFSLSLLVSEKVYLGSQLLVSAQTLNQSIIVPFQEAPKLQTVINEEKKVALLQLVEDINAISPVEICQKYGVTGECRYQQWNGTHLSISLDSVPSCLCFQVRRRDGGPVGQSCPFQSSKELLERTWQRVQVSMAPARTNVGKPALAWNLTAPCRLEAELWLCRMERSAFGQDCREVEGSRQKVESRRQGDRKGHWVKGEFLGFVPLPSMCVQVQVTGMDRPLDPRCPFSASRWRWVFPVVLGAAMICVAVLGACLFPGTLKGCVSRWCKDDGLRGAVCRRQVVLLCPPDLDPAVAVLVSRLGTALCSLGLAVTADLWSRAELGARGPVPWLYGQLDRLGPAGGQVVLILTPAAWERLGRCPGAGPEERGRGTSPYADVFGAALGCLLADALQGGHRGRFTLARFEGLPSPGSGGAAPGPPSAHGLRPYALPSQCLPFVMELTGRSLVRSWPASRVLERALRECGERGPGSGDPGEALSLMGPHKPQTHKDWGKDTPRV